METLRRLLRALAAVGLLAAAAGCPSARDPVPAGEERVRVGQRYRYALGADEVEQVYVVEHVAPEAVRYRVETRVAGRALGSPLRLEFPRDPSPGLEGAPRGDETSYAVPAGGLLPCRLSEAAEHRLWTAVGPDGRPDFPGLLRVVEGEEVVLELVAVDEGG